MYPIRHNTQGKAGSALNIQVPITKKNIKPYDCVKKAMAVYLGKKRCFPYEIDTDKFNIEVEEAYVYYPYWIGTVWTSKERALAIYPDKQITYYVVTDAISGSYIVLRNIPKLNVEKCTEDKALPARISENKLKDKILNEAISERINKQFIFGAPLSKKRECFQIHLPMIKVKIRRWKSEENFKDFYVNIFTGEVKHFNNLS